MCAGYGRCLRCAAERTMTAATANISYGALIDY
jgi:hypothetical protein